MKKFYQVVTIHTYKPCEDEFLMYEGDDLEKAKDVCAAELRCNGKYYTTEIREFEYDTEEFDIEAALAYGYNIVEVDA